MPVRLAVPHGVFQVTRMAVRNFLTSGVLSVAAVIALAAWVRTSTRRDVDRQNHALGIGFYGLRARGAGMFMRR